MDGGGSGGGASGGGASGGGASGGGASGGAALPPGVSAADLRALQAWYPAAAPTLVQALDALAPPARLPAAQLALRLCVADVFRPAAGAAGAGGGGICVSGRVEGGWIAPHTRVVVSPGGEAATVKSVSINGASVPFAAAGDTVDVLLGGLDLDAGGGAGLAAAQQVLGPGCVLCWASHPLAPALKLKARISTLPTLEMPIVAGQQFTLHCHALEEPCNVTRLLRTLDRAGRTREARPRLVGRAEVAVVRIRLVRPCAVETYADSKRLGRFVLRYGGRTVAAGMVLKVAAR